MFLLDGHNALVDSEFSLGILEGTPCVIVESSGGSNPARGVKRRNPDYNKLVGLILQRLKAAEVRITGIVLDSQPVADLPISERTAQLDRTYPIDLSAVEDIDDFRRTVGRAIAVMHRAPKAKAGGNAQKRIRICLDKHVLPEQLRAEQVNADLPDDTADHAPGLTTTETAYLRNARLGQGQFRIDLLDAFGGTCPVLGITNPELLVASHIKPWSACTNQERVDLENGILLSALIDRLFDRGLITFDSGGTLRTSPRVTPGDLARCGVDQPISIQLPTGSLRYLEYHRASVFKRE